MAHDVFISHSSVDKTVADAVCAALESHKIRCWIAPRDVPAGKPYAASLVNAISNSRVFVLLLSEDSNQSAHVLREVGEAVDNGIPIIPFRIQDIEPSEEMRYYIKSVHWLDAMDPPLERHLGRLTESVLALLSVDEDRPSVQVAQRAEIPVARRRSFPLWTLVILSLAVVFAIGGIGGWVYTQLSPSSSDPLLAAPITPDSHETEQGFPKTTESTQSLTDAQDATSQTPDEEWRALHFNPTDDSLWRQTEEDSYTAKRQTEQNAWAWSDEVVEGDFVLEFDLSSPDYPTEGTMVVYGNSSEYSYGSLLFVINSAGFDIVQHTPFEEENWLVARPMNIDFKDNHVRIEVIKDTANIYVDDHKLTYTFDNGFNKMGKIAIHKFWQVDGEITFSNIRIKMLNNLDE